MLVFSAVEQPECISANYVHRVKTIMPRSGTLPGMPQQYGTHPPVRWNELGLATAALAS